MAIPHKNDFVPTAEDDGDDEAETGLQGATTNHHIANGLQKYSGPQGATPAKQTFLDLGIEMDAALALPPFIPPNLPSATAAGFLAGPSLAGSAACPVDMPTISLASMLGSLGRFGLPDVLLMPYCLTDRT